MSLARLFTTAGVTAELARSGKVLSPPVGVLQWEDADGTERATVSFGPFAEPVTIDAVIVHIAGTVKSLRAVQGGGTFTLPAGMEWEYTLTLSASIEQV